MEAPNMEAGIGTRDGVPPKTRDPALDAPNDEGIISGADGKKYLSPLQKISLGLLGLKVESLSERMVRRDLYKTATGAMDSPEYIDMVLANLHQERARSLVFFDTVDRVSHATVERMRNLLFPVKKAETAKKRWLGKTLVAICHRESSTVPKDSDSVVIPPLADWKQKMWEESRQRRMAEAERLSQEKANTKAWYDELVQGWNNDRAVAVANRILAEAALVDQEKSAVEPKEPTTMGERLAAANQLWTRDIAQGERKVDQDNRAVEPKLSHTMDARFTAFDRLGPSDLARGPNKVDKEKGWVESKTTPASDASLVELDQLWASDPLLARLGIKATRLIPREKNLDSPAQIEIVKGDVQAQQSDPMDDFKADIKRALERGTQRAHGGKKGPINVTVLDLSRGTEKVEEAGRPSTRHIELLEEHVARKANWVAVAGPELPATDEPLRGGAPMAEEEDSLHQYAHFFSETDEVPVSKNRGPIHEPEQHLTAEEEEFLEQNAHLLEGNQALPGSYCDPLREPEQHLPATHAEMGGLMEQHDAVVGEDMNELNRLIDGYIAQSITNGTMSEAPVVGDGMTSSGRMTGHMAMYPDLGQQHPGHQSSESDASIVARPEMPPLAPRPKVYMPEEETLLIELKDNKSLSLKQIVDFFPRQPNTALKSRYWKNLRGKQGPNILWQILQAELEALTTNYPHGVPPSVEARLMQASGEEAWVRYGQMAHEIAMMAQQKQQQPHEAMMDAQAQIGVDMGTNNLDLRPSHQRSFIRLVQQDNLPEGSILMDNIPRQPLPAPPGEQQRQLQINMQRQEQPQTRMQGQQGGNLETQEQHTLCSKEQMLIEELVQRMSTETPEAKQQAIREQLIVASDPTQVQHWIIGRIDPLEQCFEQQPMRVFNGRKPARQWAVPREGGLLIHVLYYLGLKMERKIDAVFLPDLSLAYVGLCEDVHEHADEMEGQSPDAILTKPSASDASSTRESLARLPKRRILVLGRTEPTRWDVIHSNEFAIMKEILRDDSDHTDQERRMDEWLGKQATSIVGSALAAPLANEKDLDYIPNMLGSSSHPISVNSEDKAVPPHPLSLSVQDLQVSEHRHKVTFHFFDEHIYDPLGGMDVSESEKSDFSSLQLAMREKKLNEEYDDKGRGYINSYGYIAGGIGTSLPNPSKHQAQYHLPNPLAFPLDPMQVSVRNPLANGLLARNVSMLPDNSLGVRLSHTMTSKDRDDAGLPNTNDREDLALREILLCISCKCEDGDFNCDLNTDTPGLHTSAFIRNICRCAKFVDDVVRHDHVWLSPGHPFDCASSSSGCSDFECDDACGKCCSIKRTNLSEPSNLAGLRLGDRLAVGFALKLTELLSAGANRAVWEANAAHVDRRTFSFNDLLQTRHDTSETEDNAYFLRTWNFKAMTMRWWHTRFNKDLQPPRFVPPVYLQRVRLAPPIQEEIEQEVLPTWRLDKWQVGKAQFYLKNPYDTMDWSITQIDLSQRRRRDQDIPEAMGGVPLETKARNDMQEHVSKKPKRMEPTPPVSAMGLRGGCLEPINFAEYDLMLSTLPTPRKRRRTLLSSDPLYGSSKRKWTGQRSFISTGPPQVVHPPRAKRQRTNATPRYLERAMSPVPDPPPSPPGTPPPRPATVFEEAKPYSRLPPRFNLDLERHSRRQDLITVNPDYVHLELSRTDDFERFYQLKTQSFGNMGRTFISQRLRAEETWSSWHRLGRRRRDSGFEEVPDTIESVFTDDAQSGRCGRRDSAVLVDEEEEDTVMDEMDG